LIVAQLSPWLAQPDRLQLAGEEVILPPARRWRWA